MGLKYNILLFTSRWGRLYSFLLRRMVRREGGDAFSSIIREVYIKRYGIHIGYGSYGGCFKLENIPSGTHIGNYCSIGRDVKIFRANHPLDYFTLHPLFYNPAMGYVKRDLLTRPNISIGHDVWIGDNVIITPSVMSIGNGAVIGAGSVVTKDVAEYTVVAGNPAREIKKRFSHDAMNDIKESQWWILCKDDLIKRKEEFESLTNVE